jgi:hypothetical protein
MREYSNKGHIYTRIYPQQRGLGYRSHKLIGAYTSVFRHFYGVRHRPRGPKAKEEKRKANRI